MTTAPHAPTELTVRRLAIDLSKGFSRHWNGGDAFMTAYANALSMSFPVGEQFFIDAVKHGAKALPDTPENADLHKVVKGFIGQEATHRRIHSLFNQQLEAQGLTNAMERRIARRLQAHAHLDVRMHVAATAATEAIVPVGYRSRFGHPAPPVMAPPARQDTPPARAP